MDRRTFFRAGASVAIASLASRTAPVAAQAVEADVASPDASPPVPTPAVPSMGHASMPAGQVNVVTPNGSTLPLRLVNGVKVGHLVAEPVRNTFAPGLTTECWGYNGSTPGPTIEAVEGDRLRIYVTNRLPEPTTVHWHGLVLPNGMDGVAGLSQRPIPPGETYVYDFTLRYPGTYMYHPHYDEMTQIALGMTGMFIVHPLRPRGARVDRDFVLMMHEWKIDPGARRPNPNAMSDFNVLTFNGKSYPLTAPLVVGKGERVRIRLGNLGPMDHHPIHLHGLSFEMTATDGGYVAPSARHPETTVLVPVGSTRVIEFVPEESGDWAMHCHMTHHVMTQMGHARPMVGANTRGLDRRMSRVEPGYMTMGTQGMGGMGDMPMDVPENSAPMRGGRGPFGSIDMGGMFTLLKVRDDPSTADPDGWYRNPRGTVAGPAERAQMAADGIDTGARPSGEAGM